jgi:hypothetical protein
MKNTKSTHTHAGNPRATEASGSFAGIDMPFKQAAAFEQVMATTGNEEFAAAAKVISIGLFILGLDSAGDYCLAELTDALFGKGSEDAAETFNAIVSAGDTAGLALGNAQRAARQAFANAEDAGA